MAGASSVPARIRRIAGREETQRHTSPATTYSVFVDGQFRTPKILTPAKPEKPTAGLEQGMSGTETDRRSEDAAILPHQNNDLEEYRLPPARAAVPV
ncbi:MAG: YoaP domain-containing protein [Rikenellaceae bacterium]|nr:YoaP domain-containing protein [Rikenellaceae bacterium]